MSIKTHKQVVGQKGEEEACKFLIKQGFSIIERNYWRKWGEIDIVAQKGQELRFVEVKTVTRLRPPAADFGVASEDYEPEENIHPWKRKRLRRVIETYLLQNDWADDLDWQVDAMSVYLNPAGELLRVEWLEDVVI